MFFRRLKVPLFWQENWGKFLLVFLFYLGGLVAGSITVKFVGAAQYKDMADGIGLFVKNMKAGGEIDRYGLALRAMQKNFLDFAVIYFAGLSVVGFPLIGLWLAWRGFRLGFTVGFLARVKSYQGLILGTVALLPHQLLEIPVFFLAGALAFGFSLSLLRGRREIGRAGVGRRLILYTVMMLLLGLVLFLGCLVEGYLSPAVAYLLVRYLSF